MAQIKAYNTKTGKYQVIHPSFVKDKNYLAQRGLIVQEPAKEFKPTNMPAVETLTEEAAPIDVPTPIPAKTKTSK